MKPTFSSNDNDTNRTLIDARTLVNLVMEGKALEAFDRFYGEDISMQENNEKPVIGKAENRAREEGFLAMVGEVNEFAVKSITASGNQSAIHWTIDFTTKDRSKRFRFDEVALQTWEDGQITSERFIYDTANLVTEL